MRMRNIDEKSCELPRFLIAHDLHIISFLLENIMTLNNDEINLRVLRLLDRIPIHENHKEPMARDLKKQEFKKNIDPFLKYLNVFSNSVPKANLLYCLQILKELSF